MSKLKSLSQTHGKVEGVRPTTLDQIWGDTGMSKYGTFDAAVYRAQLSEMTKADIRVHARKMGIVPIDNREMLTKSLMRQFNLHVANYNRPQQNISPALKTVPKEVLDILAEGK